MRGKSSDPDVTDFSHAIGLLVRRARAAAASEELSWTETAVLKCLVKQGPMTTADLARAQGMRPQSMRAIVAALEQLGMVSRRPHATDGRQVNIELTPRGSAIEKSSSDRKRTWLAQAIAQLDTREKETLFAAGKIIERLVRQ